MSDKQDQARRDLESYAKAMIDNRIGECIAIEKRYELFGYPPELVCIGLRAAADGLDIDDAIEEHMQGAV